MAILDNLDQMKQLDQSNTLGSIEHLPQQCEHAWNDANQITVPESYQQINKVVMTGMGGSGLGARIIESVYSNNLTIPLVRINDYDLPDWVDNQTLVICSSFSGTTEEPVQNAHQAITKKAKWMAIASGGMLIKLAKQNNVPYYHIIPTHNPSKEPRLAIGYSVIGQLVMASKTGIFHLNHQELDQIISVMKQVQADNNSKVIASDNPAKILATKFEKKLIIFVVARHLIGPAHAIKNQMNENAKHFSTLYTIPELNHHLMEGLAHPNTNPQNLEIFFIESDLYPERIQQRFEITKQVVKKNNISLSSWKATSTTPLEQSFEFIQFGGYTNFYLSMLHNLDPAPVPWVDYFKNQLGQPLGQWK